MQDVKKQLLDALNSHHEAAMGAGLDMSHALSQLRVKAYKESQLCRDTVAAIAAAEQAQQSEPVQPEHVLLTAAGSEDKAVYASIASNYHQPPAVAVPDGYAHVPPASPVPLTDGDYKTFKLGWLECEAAHRAMIAAQTTTKEQQK